MALTEFQRAFLKNALISKDQVIDPATGSPLDWDALGGSIDGISDVPGLQAALDAKQAAATAATDAEVAAAIAALSSVYQPLDSDLTSIAALSTTSFGRSLLALADAAALEVVAPPTYAEGLCSADTTITGSNQMTDITGCSIALAAGNWKVEAAAVIGGATSYNVVAIRIGSTTQRDAQTGNIAGGTGGLGAHTINVPAVKVAGSQTVKLSFQCDGASAKAYKDIVGSGVPETLIWATRVA